jgi:hypothetical protein
MKNNKTKLQFLEDNLVSDSIADNLVSGKTYYDQLSDFDKGSLLAAFLWKAGHKNPLWKVWFPNFLTISDDDIDQVTFDTVTALVRLKELVKIRNSVIHPVDRVKVVLETTEVKVTTNTLSYSSADGPVVLQKHRGLFEPNVNVAQIAAMSDRAFYSEKRGTAISQPTFPSKPVAMPFTKIDIIPTQVDRKVQNEDYRTVLFLSFKKNLQLAFKAEHNLTKHFPSTCIEANPNEPSANRNWFPKFTIPLIPLTYKIDLDFFYGMLENHVSFRGSGRKGQSTPCAGFYAFTAPPSIAKLYSTVADTVSLALEYDKSMLVPISNMKRYNSNWAMSVIASGIRVASMDTFGKARSPEGIYPRDYIILDECVMLGANKPWPQPTNLASKAAGHRKYTNPAKDEVKEKIGQILKMQGSYAVEVFVTPPLKDYVAYLYPSSRGNEGLVWLCNKQVNKFRDFEEVLRRCCSMCMALTIYPFSLQNYIDIDTIPPAAYLTAITLRTVPKKLKLGTDYTQDFELEIKKLNEPVPEAIINLQEEIEHNTTINRNKQEVEGTRENIAKLRRETAAKEKEYNDSVPDPPPENEVPLILGLTNAQDQQRATQISNAFANLGVNLANTKI